MVGHAVAGVGMYRLRSLGVVCDSEPRIPQIDAVSVVPLVATEIQHEAVIAEGVLVACGNGLDIKGAGGELEVVAVDVFVVEIAPFLVRITDFEPVLRVAAARSDAEPALLPCTVLGVDRAGNFSRGRTRTRVSPLMIG